MFESHTVLIDVEGSRFRAISCEFEICHGGSFMCEVEVCDLGGVWKRIGGTTGGMAPWYIDDWPIVGKFGVKLANMVQQQLFRQLAADEQSMWRLAPARMERSGG